MADHVRKWHCLQRGSISPQYIHRSIGGELSDRNHIKVEGWSCVGWHILVNVCLKGYKNAKELKGVCALPCTYLIVVYRTWTTLSLYLYLPTFPFIWHTQFAIMTFFNPFQMSTFLCRENYFTLFRYLFVSYSYRAIPLLWFLLTLSIVGLCFHFLHLIYQCECGN